MLWSSRLTSETTDEARRRAANLVGPGKADRFRPEAPPHSPERWREEERRRQQADDAFPDGPPPFDAVACLGGCIFFALIGCGAWLLLKLVSLGIAAITPLF